MKRIPIAGGLGGGSSDAGAVLRALQRLSPAPLSPGRLHRLAAGLGADVPFFLQDAPCRATGIGDILEPLQDFPRFWVLLACAPFGLATREVYENLKKTLTSTNEDVTNGCPVLVPALRRFVPVLRNDLQLSAERLRPAIGKARKGLFRAGASGAMISGSGPTVFAVFGSRDDAVRALANVRREHGWTYLVARGNPARKRATV